MAANTDIFPSFAECSRQARDIERSMISAKPSLIPGTLHSDEGKSIFPPEFDEYTAAYLFSEAQKVERKLFANNYQASLTSPPSSQPERGMESELHQLAALPPDQQQGNAPQPQAPGLPKMPGFHIADILRRKEPRAQETQQHAPPQPPAQQYAELQHEPAPVQHEQQPAPVPPRVPALHAAAPAEAQPMEGEAKEGGTEEPAGPQEADAPGIAAGAEKTAARPLALSSKISPRLRAIIEEKLRREEQGAAKESNEIEKEPSPQEDAAPEEAPAFSARERLLRRLQRQRKGPSPEGQQEEGGQEPQEEGPSAPALEQQAEGEEAQDEAVQPSKKLPIKQQEDELPGEPQEIAQPEGQLQEEEQEAQEQPLQKPRQAQKAGLGYGGKETGPGDYESPEEKAETGEEEGPVLPAAGRKPPAAMPHVRPGKGITITPIFSGEEERETEAEASQPAADEESAKRMDRIRRIMDELSPDRAKAKATASKPAPSGEPEEEAGQAEAGAPEKRAGKTALAIKPPMAKKAEAKPLPKKQKKGRKQKAEEAQESPSYRPQEEEAQEEGEGAALDNAPRQKGAAKAAAGKSGARAVAKAPAAKQVKGALPTAKASRKPAAAQVPIPSRKPAAAVPTPAKAPVQQAPAQIRQPTIALQPKKGVSPAAYQQKPEAAAAKKTAIPAQPMPRQPEARARMIPSVQPVSRAAAARENLAPMAQAAPRPAAVAARPRILPGGMQQQASTRTYVPPARRKPILPEQQEEAEAQQPEEAPPEEPAAPARQLPGKQQMAQEEEPREEDAGQGQGEEPQPIQVSSAAARLRAASLQNIAAATPKKQALDEPGLEKSPEDIEEERRIAAKAEKLSQMSSNRDIAGEAEVPSQDDELDVPKPPPEDAEPGSGEYEEAKEGFKRKMQQEGIREKTRADADALLEAYAKENLIWLYEIYSMGGMPKEDFLQKVKEKMAEDGVQQGQGQAEAPPNQALANLGKEIDKRYKK